MYYNNNIMNSNVNNNLTVGNSNVLPKFKTPLIFYPILLMILFLIVCIFVLMYNKNYSLTIQKPNVQSPSQVKSQNEIVANIFILFTFIILAVILSICLLPNFKELKTFFSQISNVLYVVFYTIFLIIFYLFTPKNIITDYAKIILPITILFSVLFFYKSLSVNYIEKFNVNYERIKSIILFVCFIITIIIFYNINPGGYITEYFGYSLLLTSIISVFALLYLVTLLTLTGATTASKTNPSGNPLYNISSFSKYGGLGLILFLIIITSLITTYEGGFFNYKELASSVMIILIIIVSLWTVLLGSNVFPEFLESSIDVSKFEMFKKALLFLFGVIITGLTMFWVVYNIKHFSSSNIGSLILNIIIVLIVLILIYKTINVQLPKGNSNKNGFFDMFLNIITFIPCLFSKVFENTKNFVLNEYKITPFSSIIIIFVTIILFAIYFILPTVYNKIYLQNGKLLVNNPVYTDRQYQLGTYEELNGSDNFDYQYAISFWVFIDAAPPNSNASSQKYTSLLNFGEKPNVLYNSETNTLMVTMQQKDLQKTTKNKLTDFDDKGNRILYTNNNMLLQKWNNIVINYNGGILDIFLNGELVKSDIGVVPYYTLDNLTIGEENGVNGGICNVVYFNKTLSSTNIYLLYNIVKNKTPPIINNNNETIIKNNTKNNIQNGAKNITNSVLQNVNESIKS